jgi:hypothetical protein
MKRDLLLILLFGISLMLAPAASAQDNNDSSSQVKITWPMPVTEVWGSGDVIGTAAVPGMAYYYLEYLALNPDLSLPDNAPWIPATIAVEKVVTDGRLATFDTTQVPDGLYALRLVVNTIDGDTFADTITPIRINNERYQQVRAAIIQEALAEPTAQPPTQVTATPQAGQVLVYPAAPITAVNVRRCDLVDNYRCAYVASLTTEGGEILAISSNGSGWYQVQVASGATGWVSPTVISISGDVSNLPRVLPPAPLAPTSVPPAGTTVTNAIPNGIAIEGNNPVCGQVFNAHINIANTGNAISQAGSVSLQDVHARTGGVAFTNSGTFPALNPGSNFVVVIPVVVSVYAKDQHELRAYAGGRTISVRYILAQGNCVPHAGPPDAPVDATRDFPPNQCFMVFPGNTPAYNAPFGSIISYLGAATKESRQGRFVNNSAWYRVNYLDLGDVWVRRTGPVTAQGDCSIRR